MSPTMNVVMLAVAAVFGLLYVMRRRNRLRNED
jgi:hypothetical protein